MNETPPIIQDHMAIFTLKTGEKIRVALAETGLCVQNQALLVMAEQTLLLKPGAANSIYIYTPKSHAAERAEIVAIVAEREAKMHEARKCIG